MGGKSWVPTGRGGGKTWMTNPNPKPRFYAPGRSGGSMGVKTKF